MENYKVEENITNHYSLDIKIDEESSPYGFTLKGYPYKGYANKNFPKSWNNKNLLYIHIWKKYNSEGELYKKKYGKMFFIPSGQFAEVLDLSMFLKLKYKLALRKKGSSGSFHVEQKANLISDPKSTVSVSGTNMEDMKFHYYSETSVNGRIVSVCYPVKLMEQIYERKKDIMDFDEKCTQSYLNFEKRMKHPTDEVESMDVYGCLA